MSNKTPRARAPRKSKNTPAPAPAPDVNNVVTSEAPVVTSEAPVVTSEAPDKAHISALLAQIDELQRARRATPPAAPVVVSTSQVGADALRGRVGCRTHAMHAVLIAAYREGRVLQTRDIVAGARALLGASHPSYEKLDRTAPSHINTMKRRLFLERVMLAVDGGASVSVTGWRLTTLGAQHCNLI